MAGLGSSPICLSGGLVQRVACNTSAGTMLRINLCPRCGMADAAVVGAEARDFPLVLSLRGKVARPLVSQ